MLNLIFTGEWTLLSVLIGAMAGGMLVKLFNGCELPKCLPFCGGKTIKPCCKFTLPDVIGMIFFGCIFRSYLVQHVHLDDYNEKEADKLQALTLGTIFLIGGMNLNFNVDYKLVLSLAILPLLFEALVVFFLSYQFTDLDAGFALMLGLIIGGIGPGIMFPKILKMKQEGCGSKKKIPQTILAASCLQFLILFLILGFQVPLTLGSEFDDFSYYDSTKDLFAELFTGIAVGSTVGLTGYFLKERSKVIKALGAVIPAIIILMVFKYTLKYELGKLIAVICLGFVQSRFYPKHIPHETICNVWEGKKFMLFGTIGASIYLKDLDTGVLLWGIIIILIATITKAVFIKIFLNKTNYTEKEKHFYVVSMIPKAVVQAVIGSRIYQKTQSYEEKNEIILHLQKQGQIILTISIISIFVNGIIGIVLVHYGADNWLEKEDHSKQIEIESLETVKTEKGLSLDISIGDAY